ncbi:glycoside hydrolase [Pelobium manganitolerans]|uniref:Beta-galactosidase n=1 Tax=Pelobium manganitolerans TaxID=1842495 RepID=A0A419S283_9SPHI|nr:glycoside hydrolase family 2 TIM barrel-domain containing protein [Pelobium manganitolerans]RKD12849.1 glycoside hydrolase [Pelobium manganitolerans]
MFRKLLFSLFMLSSYLLTNAQTQKQVQYLSGTDNENTVTWDFWCTGGRNSGKWSKIQVPSHWEQQGFGNYNYGRDYVTYGKNFRFADEKGLYRYKFNVPADWQNQTVQIVFEGSMTDTEVKINGKSAGAMHQGAFYRFKYDISDKLNFGKENLLEVTVSKMSADRSVNNAERLADYWIFGGIFRPVYLEATPKEHIEWTSIDAKADGSFAMNVHLQQAQKNTQVTADIIDAQGKTVATAKAVNSNGSDVVKLLTSVKKPALWTAETPNLYRVKVYLKNANGNLTYHTEDKFGFRTIEIRKSDGIYVNGQKVKMKGINRHVWWPETGRSVNPRLDLMDVKLIKGMNMNAVRCSHYPPDKAFLNYCDSLGLYVLDELAGWQQAYSTKAGEPLVKEMVIRDANHPSIIFWSNGNEGGHNFDLDDDYGKYDLSNRPVIHAHHKPGNAFNGIDGNHYEDFYSTQKILADSNIYMVTEFMHAQDDGAGAAGLSDMWDLHWNAKRGAGGFIWAFVDEGIVRTDRNGMIDVNGVNAPDGVLGPHREKEGSYNAIKEIYSPFKIRMETLPINFDGTIEVENRYNFLNLNTVSLKWDLINFKLPTDETAGFTVLESGTAKAPNIPAYGKGNFKLPLPKNWKQAQALALTATDIHGEELYRWVWKIAPNSQIVPLLYGAEQKNTGKASASEDDSTITLRGGDISVSLSKSTGRIVALGNSKSMPLSFNNGPVLVSGDAKLTAINQTTDGDKVIVNAKYEGNLNSVTWTMYPSGWLQMDYSYTLNGKFPFAGISFDYPENFILGTKWLGKGPYRVWKNRLQGVTFNTWESFKNNTQTGSFPYIFPEFKGYFSDVSWVQFNTVEGKFIVATPQENMYLRLFDFYGLTGIKPHPALPAGDISFLDAIPAIGSKLGLKITPHPERYGPAGEPAEFNGETKRTLWFYFGLQQQDEENKQFVMPTENILTD